MRKILVVALVVLALAVTATVALADKPVGSDSHGNQMTSTSRSCTKIQSGTLRDAVGAPIATGNDVWGYNYQAHMFNGKYCMLDRNASDCRGDSDTDLITKWNDAYLANTDCNGDGLLDRHYGYPSYIGSGAWVTNHQKGAYEQDGKTCSWEYFIKIIAAPADAALTGGIWYAADGTKIGPSVGGQLAIIQEVYNDPCAGEHGILYLSPDHAGFGGW